LSVGQVGVWNAAIRTVTGQSSLCCLATGLPAKRFWLW